MRTCGASSSNSEIKEDDPSDGASWPGFADFRVEVQTTFVLVRAYWGDYKAGSTRAVEMATPAQYGLETVGMLNGLREDSREGNQPPFLSCSGLATQPARCVRDHARQWHSLSSAQLYPQSPVYPIWDGNLWER